MHPLAESLRAYADQPWPMEPRALANLVGSGEGAAGLYPPASGPRLTTSRRGAVAVIPLEGVILPWKAEAFADAVLSAADDSAVGAIVLSVDSPGGTIGGVPEAADAIYTARQSKPVLAVTTGINASAAYWLTSTAHRVISSPSGYTGSIGVWMMHADISKMLEQAGIDVTLVSAGKYKVEGNMFEPLGDEARGAIQEDVNDAYTAFLDAVAKHRGTTRSAVREGYGQGRVLNATRARSAGLIDGIGTLASTIGQLSGSSAGRNSANLLRKLRLDEYERESRLSEIRRGV